MFIFYYFWFSLLIEFIISIALLFHFYCYTQVSTLILHIATLIFRIFRIFIQISDQEFKKINTLVQKQHFALILLHNPRDQIIACIIWDTISDITKKKITLKCLETIICKVNVLFL